MKPLTVIGIGARQQFIKAATVSKTILENSSIKEIIVHTGQHYDENMSDIFYKEMRIPKPNYNLSIGGGNHGASTGKMLAKLKKFFF